jgi:glycyl-tRNA synthetase
VLGLHPSLAPIKAAVFALTKKDGQPEMAQPHRRRAAAHFPVDYDETGSIGKRYRRQDEVGTPFCITVDGDSTKDGTVTVRDRDTLKQERIAADALRAILWSALGHERPAVDRASPPRGRRSWRSCRASTSARTPV